MHWQRVRFNGTTRAEEVEIPPEKMFNMPYVYVKDSEGFVFKKKLHSLTDNFCKFLLYVKTIGSKTLEIREKIL